MRAVSAVSSRESAGSGTRLPPARPDPSQCCCFQSAAACPHCGGGGRSLAGLRATGWSRCLTSAGGTNSGARGGGPCFWSRRPSRSHKGCEGARELKGPHLCPRLLRLQRLCQRHRHRFPFRRVGQSRPQLLMRLRRPPKRSGVGQRCWRDSWERQRPRPTSSQSRPTQETLSRPMGPSPHPRGTVCSRRSRSSGRHFPP